MTDSDRREQIAQEVEVVLDALPWQRKRCKKVADFILQREAALRDCLLEGWIYIHREHNSGEPEECEKESCQGGFCSAIRRALEGRTP